MAGTRRIIPIEEKLAKAQAEYDKAKMKYIFASAKLEKIKDKYEKVKRERIAEMLLNSDKSIEEIERLLEKKK